MTDNRPGSSAPSTCPPAPSPSRTAGGRWRRAGQAVVVLGLCAVFVKWPARPGEGPVIWVLSAQHGWGVHLGDLLCLPAAGWACRSLLRALRP